MEGTSTASLREAARARAWVGKGEGRRVSRLVGRGGRSGKMGNLFAFSAAVESGREAVGKG